MTLNEYINDLVCPSTLQPLEICSIDNAERIMGGRLVSCRRKPAISPPLGPTEIVLVREDRLVAYPVVGDIPILLIPESLIIESNIFEIDLSHRKYKESYAEADFYSSEVNLAEDVEIFDEQIKKFQSHLELPNSMKVSFPEPKETWIDAVYDCVAQYEAYNFLNPIHENPVLQIGGKGLSALEFLAAGASSACLVTPFVTEAQYAKRLARALGLDARLQSIVGLAEELPLRTESVKRIYVGGSLHHMQPDLSAKQFQRVLTVGGRFAAVEPWRAPFYDIGTGIFGKREANAYCYPLTDDFMAAFSGEMSGVNVYHHGTLSRYLSLAVSKIGVKLNIRGSWRIQSFDDLVIKEFTALRKHGSSVAILAEKGRCRICPLRP